MLIFKTRLLLLLCILLFGKHTFAQEDSTNITGPSAEWTVQAHKQDLKLTLLIDSIEVGEKMYKLHFKRTINLQFESEYLQVKDAIYIKIFIARNQEYGKKFYSWKWDYWEKSGDTYNSLASGNYIPMEFNQLTGNYGQGIGIDGTPDHLMFHYRYKLE